MAPYLYRLALIGSLVLAFFVLRCRDVQHQRREGAMRAELRQADSVVTLLTRRTDSLLREYKRDTVRLVQWRTRWEAAKAEVRFDTLRFTDTVTVPVQVLVTADSTIRSCSAALVTCDQIRVTLEDQLRFTEKQRDVYRKQIPSFGTTAFRTLRDVAIGVAIGRAIRP